MGGVGGAWARGEPAHGAHVVLQREIPKSAFARSVPLALTGRAAGCDRGRAAGAQCSGSLSKVRLGSTRNDYTRVASSQCSAGRDHSCASFGTKSQRHEGLAAHVP